MRLPPDVPVEPPTFPGDSVARAVVPGVDDAAVVELATDAFRDQAPPLTFDLRVVRAAHAASDFDPATVLLMAPASDPAHLVGFARVTRYRDDDGREVGDVRTLGLRPGWRGRGLGRSLLRWAVRTLRERGATDVYLTVEAADGAALRLYERTGFLRHVEWPHWTLPVPDEQP